MFLQVIGDRVVLGDILFHVLGPALHLYRVVRLLMLSVHQFKCQPALLLELKIMFIILTVYTENSILWYIGNRTENNVKYSHTEKIKRNQYPQNHANILNFIYSLTIPYIKDLSLNYTILILSIR